MDAMARKQRLHPRYSAPFRVVVTGDEARQMQVLTDDVSGNGLFLATSHELPVGSPLQLSIHLPDGRREVCCRGVIVRRAQPSNEGRCGYGVQLEFDKPELAVEYLHRIDRLSIGPAAPDRSRYRILLIEDNVLMSRMIENTLPRTWRQHFCVGPELKIDTALSGEQGLCAIEEIPYQLVITDMYMPGMDGIEVTRQIRNMPTRRDTPILLLTAIAPEYGLDVVDVDACLIKPVQQQALMSAVQLLLAGRTDASRGSAPAENASPLIDALRDAALHVDH